MGQAHGMHHREDKKINAKCEITGVKKPLVRGQFVYKQSNGLLAKTRWYRYRKCISRIFTGMIYLHHPEANAHASRSCMRCIRALLRLI
jgi:hypothetical protein